MTEPLDDDALPRPVEPASVLNGLATAALLSWVGIRAGTLGDVYAQVGVSLPQVTRLLLSVPIVVYLLSGVALGAALVLKDRFLSVRAARLVNACVVPVLFLLFLLAHEALSAPLMELLKGISTRR